MKFRAEQEAELQRNASGKGLLGNTEPTCPSQHGGMMGGRTRNYAVNRADGDTLTPPSIILGCHS
eukprot:9251413-Pyramimonas_sp.AAC.1